MTILSFRRLRQNRWSATRRCSVVAVAFLMTGVGCRAPAAGSASTGGAIGVYAGTMRYYRFPGPVSTSRRLFGAIGRDGIGYFISTYPVSGELQVFRHLERPGKVTSPEYEVPTEEQTAARGVQTWEIEIKPRTGNTRSYELRGKFNHVDGYTALKLRELPQSHTSIASRSGEYEGVHVNGGTEVGITLGSDGRLRGTDASGCRISGRVSRLEKPGLFEVRMTLTGRPACRTAVRGVALFDTRDRTGRFSAAGPYLYLIGANSELSHAVAMVLVQRSPR